MSDVAVLDDELDALFDGKRQTDPYPIFTAVRERAPVVELDAMMVVARYDDIRGIVADTERFSSEFWVRGSRAEQIVARFSPEGQRMWRELAAYDRNFISRSQGEQHERLRKSAHRYFTPRRIQALTDVIQGFVDDLLDEVSVAEVHDQKWLAGDLALRVMSHVIGSPQVDREYIRELADIRGRYLGTPHEHLVREAYSANKEFDAYIRDVILAGHRRDPGANELAAALMAAEDEQRLSTDEVVATIINLIIGGLETTAILFTNGVLELMRYRDQWQRLCDDPDGLASSAVEELLRWVSPAQWSQRIATQDTEWAGVAIPAETTVTVVYAAANRDPRVYEDPERLDVGRSSQNLALGFGAHFCLGASLIRNEARILFATLAKRYPELRLAIDVEDVDWSQGNPLLRTPAELPVVLGPRRSA